MYTFVTMLLKYLKCLWKKVYFVVNFAFLFSSLPIFALKNIIISVVTMSHTIIIYINVFSGQNYFKIPKVISENFQYSHKIPNIPGVNLPLSKFPEILHPYSRWWKTKDRLKIPRCRQYFVLRWNVFSLKSFSFVFCLCFLFRRFCSYIIQPVSMQNLCWMKNKTPKQTTSHTKSDWWYFLQSRNQTQNTFKKLTVTKEFKRSQLDAFSP